MNKKHVEIIAEELSLKPHQVEGTAALLENGATIPFIARYRKEATGSIDEVAIQSIRDRREQLEELDSRREAILKSLEERRLLTPELKNKIDTANTRTQLEDIYLLFRPKRRTRATIACEKGLEPLARLLFHDQPLSLDLSSTASRFLNTEKNVQSVEDALAGARDIMAEWISENEESRQRIRMLYMKKGQFETTVISGKEDEAAKYKDYFKYEENVRSAPSHRVLAMRRGAKEGFLRLRVTAPEEEAIALLEDLFVQNDGPAAAHVGLAVKDSYKRLLSLAMETEVRIETKKKADEEAIKVFADNLRQLLMAPPLGQKNVLAIDPGFRTGCKVACLDRQGKLLHHDTIYPFSSERKNKEADEKLRVLCARFEIEAVAIGNGTGGRETEAFLRENKISINIPALTVNESGASIYSASQIGRDEFPDLDVSIRGAVSIGRRLIDPLAELVKIDPKSIGVGQYQHDVDQKALKRSLDDVVTSSVNSVGVDVNTASMQLLTYVSGVGPKLAQNIVTFRDEQGAFTSRDGLKNVPFLGDKAFELAAGFLRIPGGDNPLDSSAVHPESYPVVYSMAKDLGRPVTNLLGDERIRRQIEISRYVSDTIGIPTLNDIMDELVKPGRDPRKSFEVVKFSDEINTIEDLKIGMTLPGIVTNVTAFGAFVDIGVHQDGLVHISQMADRYVNDPHKLVNIHQHVTVHVLDIDLQRRRIALSMKKHPETVDFTKSDPNRERPVPPKPRKKSKIENKKSGFNTPFAELLKHD